MSAKSALVLGASGLVGGCCLDLLMKSGDYGKVFALLRRTISAKDKKLELQVVDFDRPDAFSNLLKAEDVFCCLGTTMKKAGSKEAFKKVDYEYPLLTAQAALKKGAKRFFLVSSIGADAKSSNFYLKVKGEIEEAISNLAFEAVHIFRPSLLVGDREEQRFGEKAGEALSNIFRFAFIGPLKKYLPVEAEAVAFAMLQAAKIDLKGVRIYESDEIKAIYETK